MQNPFKEFLYFSQGERRGILVLITGIILVFLSGYIYIYQREHRPLSDEVIRRQATAMAEYESFIASIQEKEQNGTTDLNLPPKTTDNRLLGPFQSQYRRLRHFCRLGLPGWMARNILRYRSKGGKFHKAEDFRKIYGMTENNIRHSYPISTSLRKTQKQEPSSCTALLQAMTAPLLSELHRKNIRLGPLST